MSTFFRRLSEGTRRRQGRRVLLIGFFICLRAMVGVPPVMARDPDLRIGLMPAVDSIPLIVAQSEGYFAQEGIAVELTIFRDQLYRETALQTNTIDGSVSDLINAIYAWQNGFGVGVTSATDGLFALIVAPRSNLRSAAAWNARRPGSIQVGLLENSIIYYVAQRMLERINADPGRLQLIPTLQVPARMEMVVAGQIEGALLPEPITQIALARGAHTLVDSRVLESTPGVILFTRRALDSKRAAILAFYRAYNRAVAAINGNPDAFRDTIIRDGEFPPLVRDSMVLPAFRPAAPPTVATFTDVLDWMRHNGLLTRHPRYAEIVFSLW